MYHGIKLSKLYYQHLLLTNDVESRIIPRLEIKINRISVSKVPEEKTIIIEKGQLVEVICMMNLDLMYYFGRVIGFESGQLILDVSRDYNKEVVYINTRDIRDLEIYTGEFKLYDHNEDDVDFDYANNNCCKFTFSDD